MSNLNGTKNSQFHIGYDSLLKTISLFKECTHICLHI